MAKALRPYQKLIIDWIISKPKCAIWSFMGSGKSVSTLTALDIMALTGQIEKPTLIVAPLRVARDVWPNEPGEWSHLQDFAVQPILGTETQRRDAFHIKANAYSINFENIEWLIKTWGEHWPYGAVVIDEATKLKSLRVGIRNNANGTEWVQGQGGKRAKALFKATYKYGTERFIELSGTPAPNGLQDLWGQAFYLDHGQRLGRLFDSFQTRWFQRDFDGYGLSPLPYAQEQIQAALKDLCMSLKSEDWFDVAKPIERTIKVQLPPDARKQYREMEKQMYTEIKSNPITAFNAGGRTQKLLQMVAGFVYLGHADDPGERKWIPTHEAKLDALEEIVEEAAGAPILVGYHFKPDLIRLLKRFPKGRHLDQKSQTIKDWNDGKIPLLFAHPGSAGHGLNLARGGNILVRFSRDWNFEQYEQILERIGPVRQAQAGLNRNVFCYTLEAEQTLDEDVTTKMTTKGNVQDILMEGMKARLSA